MSTHSPLSSELRDLYGSESLKFQQKFSATKDGLCFLQQRSALVESIALRLWEQVVSPQKGGASGHALVALGDFGRRSLFPYSEIDLLLLQAAEDETEKFNESSRRFSWDMGDLPWKLNLTTKTLSDYTEFNADNPELILSLLDCRYLAGDRELFANLRDRPIPEMMAQESQVLVGHLADITRARHRKFGNTVFHLEPNVKDGLGGYRDYTLACWLALMSAMEKQHGWPEPDAVLPAAVQKSLASAFQFLASVRCFLHFRNGQDTNVLTWAAQEDAVAQRVGTGELNLANSAEWMRIYYAHARAIDTISRQLLEEMPAAQSLFYRQLEDVAHRFLRFRFFRCGWADLFAAARKSRRSATAFPYHSLDCPARLQAQPGGGTSSGASASSIGEPFAEGMRFLAIFPGNTAGFARRGRLASHALPASAHDVFA